jgi:hypothetical protein
MIEDHFAGTGDRFSFSRFDANLWPCGPNIYVHPCLPENGNFMQ